MATQGVRVECVKGGGDLNYFLYWLGAERGVSTGTTDRGVAESMLAAFIVERGRIFSSANTRRKEARSGDREQLEEAIAIYVISRHRIETLTGNAPLSVTDALRFYLDEHVRPHKKLAGRVVKRKQIAEFAADFLNAHFGGRLVRDIVDDDFIHDQTGYILKRARGELARSEGAPIRKAVGSTARRELGVLIAALKHCATVKDPKTGKKRLALDDVPKIPRPRDGRERDRWLTYDEEATLRAAAPAGPPINSTGKPQRLSRIHRFMVLALEDGARKEAIERLTWPQVDFESDRVVPPGVTKGTVDYRNPNEPESNKRRAKVRMTGASRAMLERAFKERRSDIGFVLDEPGNIRGAFESAVKRSGLQAVSPHTLRHTWATRASQNGVSMEEIAVQLADSPQTVERTYLHHSPDHLKNAVNWRDKEAAGKAKGETI